MDMVRFVHTSDWQIGMKGGGLGNAADHIRSARIESINNIFDVATEQKADFVLISGDVFEHNQVSNSDVNAVVSVLNKYPKIPIFLLPGNHDCLGPGCVYERDIFSRIGHLTILDSCDPVFLKDVIIHPIPIKSIYLRDEKDRTFRCVKDEPGIHIGVAHGSLKTGLSEQLDFDLPIEPCCVDEAGLDYLALGHWHSLRTFEDGDGVPRIAYSGTHERTKYDEDSAGNCLLVQISSKGSPPVITPIRTGMLSWSTVEFELKDKNSLTELDDFLGEFKDVDLLKLELSGELDIKYKEELENILEYQSTLHKDLKVIEEALRFYAPIDPNYIQDLQDPTLNQVERELRKRLENEKNKRDRAILIESISLLHRLAREAY
jgi:DNA repair exonuclease SbcCD nuclease subunit